jgi:peptidyl-prolyl cis-trans isomerase C
LFARRRFWLVWVFLSWPGALLPAQTSGEASGSGAATASPAAAGLVKLPPPPGRNLVAATVSLGENKRPIPEIAVYRALRQVPLDKWKEARPEVVNFLVENAIVDLYLEALKIPVTPQEVDSKYAEVLKEIAATSKKDPKEVLQELLLTEDELRAQIQGQLRWDKFVEQQAPESKLRSWFTQHKDMFDGSAVHARHLLLSPPKGDAKAAAEARAKLLQWKKELEEQAQKAVAQLPADADPLTREKTRSKVLDEGFAALARKESACPSKVQGGDVGWFPRAGRMVEPFARAAFELNPYQISNVVETEFGLHLILLLERRPGKDVKFEEVRELVKDVYGDRLREQVLRVMRPRVQIEVAPAPKYE